MPELFQNVFFWGVLLGGLAIFVILRAITGKKQYEQDMPAERKKEDIEPEFTTVTTRATVVDQTCCVKMIGIKEPKTIKEFTITFQTEKGEMIKLNVPEEMYDGFDKDQTGMLTVVDGQLYGFELLDDPEKCSVVFQMSKGNKK